MAKQTKYLQNEVMKLRAEVERERQLRAVVEESALHSPVLGSRGRVQHSPPLSTAGESLDGDRLLYGSAAASASSSLRGGARTPPLHSVSETLHDSSYCTPCSSMTNLSTIPTTPSRRFENCK